MVELTIRVPLFAKVVKQSNESVKHDLELGKEYEVNDICMGQSSTSIILNKYEGNKVYNSIIFKFFIKTREGDKEVDIYESALFNPYMRIDLAKPLLKLSF